MTAPAAAVPAPAARDGGAAGTTGPRAARLLVWGAWAVLLLVVLACVARWGRDVPLAEDWILVAPLTGHEPRLLAWAWEPNNEHRVPLPKLLLLGLLRLTNGDFRTGMVANALVLAAMAAAAARTAARVRGGWLRWTDLFFPLLFLHLGNWENMVWGWQLQFTSSAALTLALLLTAVADPTLATRRGAATAGLSLVLVPLAGANGVIFALAMVPWVVYAAVRRWRGASGATSARGGALALLAAVAASLLAVAIYLANYERPPWIPPNPGKRDTVLTAAKFVAMAFGPAVRDHWSAWILVGALVLVPTALVLVLQAVDAWHTRGPERERTLGLVCFAGGTAVLTLALGYGRAAYVPEIGMPTRYVLLAAPALVAAYLVWELYGPPTLRRTVQAGLLVLLVALLPANTRVGFGWRDWYVAGMTAVERDVAAGVPRRELAHRNYPFLLHWNEALCADAIGWLRDTGRGPFARVAERPR